MSAQKLHRLHAHIQHDPSGDGVDRRGFLEYMAWAGTGLLWTVSAGVISSRRLAMAGEAPPPGTFHFAQISDSHIGFAAGANRDVTATLQLALARVKTLQPAPAFVLHTGDLSPRPRSRCRRGPSLAVARARAPANRSRSRRSRRRFSCL